MVLTFLIYWDRILQNVQFGHNYNIFSVVVLEHPVWPQMFEEDAFLDKKAEGLGQKESLYRLQQCPLKLVWVSLEGTK